MSFRNRLLERNTRAEESRVSGAAWETNTESVDDTQHQRLHARVYTGIENSGRLGPRALEWPQPETTSIGRICPALSTWDLFESTTAQTFCERDALPTELYPQLH
jgi:hypothetical protein